MTADFGHTFNTFIFDLGFVYLHNFSVKVAIVSVFVCFYSMVCSHIVALHLSSSQVTYV